VSLGGGSALACGELVESAEGVGAAVGGVFGIAGVDELAAGADGVLLLAAGDWPTLARTAAHSGDRDHLFRRIAIRHSDRSRAVWRGCVRAPLDACADLSVRGPRQA
jgi:hypothetical protein